MSGSHLVVGKKGELLAAKYLRERGYRIIGQNVRTRAGEIDIIVRKDDVVVFVEVKTRVKNDGFLPSDRVDHIKIKRLKGAAAAWLNGKEDVSAQIDVIGVCGEEIVEHFEDVTN